MTISNIIRTRLIVITLLSVVIPIVIPKSIRLIMRIDVATCASPACITPPVIFVIIHVVNKFVN